MKIPLKTLISFAFLIGLLTFQYQNCSSYHDPSPFELASQAGASGSSPSEMRLDSPAGVIDVSPVELALSVGGECNVGLNTKHYIEVRMLDASNTPIPVREDTECPVDAPSLSANCLRAVQFRCEHGRYYIHLPLNCRSYQGQTQALYRLLGQLVVIDSKGQEIRDNKAAFDRFFQMSWGPGACL